MSKKKKHKSGHPYKKKQCTRKKKITANFQHIFIEKTVTSITYEDSKPVQERYSLKRNAVKKTLFLSDKLWIYHYLKSTQRFFTHSIKELYVVIKNTDVDANKVAIKSRASYDIHLISRTNSPFIYISISLSDHIVSGFGQGYKEEILLNLIFKYMHLFSKAKNTEELTSLIKIFYDKQIELREKMFSVNSSGLK